MPMSEHEFLLHGSGQRLHPRNSTILWSFITRSRIYICIALFRIFHTFFLFLFELPLVRLVERAVCQEHYKSLPLGPDWHQLDEELCKTSEIQGKVAYLIGFRQSFKAVPGLLTAVSYGALADSWGRRPVLFLACLGEGFALLWLLLVCYSNTMIKVEWAWLEALFYFIGGGTRLEHALEFTILADCVPPKFRDRAILLMHSTAHLVRILALLLSSISMEEHLWLPFAAAILCMIFALTSVVALPETLQYKKKSPLIGPVDSESRTTGPAESSLSNSIAPSAEPDGDVSSKSSLERVASLIGRHGLKAILFIFFLKKMAYEGAEGSLIYQYASKQSGLKLHQTFGVRLAEIIGAVAVTLIILPIISHFWHFEDGHLGRKDLWIARISMLLEATGFYCVYNATNITSIYAAMLLQGLGQGLEPTLQNIGSFAAGKPLHAAFFVSVTFLDTFGELVGAPIMAGLFSITDSEGASVGYCFLASMCLFLAMLLISFQIRSSKIRV